jgi:hypothetical protein
METNKVTLKQPKSVKFAVVLLWASALISLLTTVTDPQAIQSLKAHPGVYILAFTIVFFFTALLITKINAGRNWARILFVMLATVSAILFLHACLLSEDIELTNLQITEGIFNNALAIFIVFLLFGKSVSPWFHQSKENTRSVSTNNKEPRTNPIDYDIVTKNIRTDKSMRIDGVRPD